MQATTAAALAIFRLESNQSPNQSAKGRGIKTSAVQTGKVAGIKRTAAAAASETRRLESKTAATEPLDAACFASSSKGLPLKSMR